jgi:hypothetical protein
VFNGGVVRFDFRCGCAGDDEDFDFVPPAADPAPEPVRLGLRGDADEFLEPALCSGGVFGRAGGLSSARNCSLTFHAACSVPDKRENAPLSMEALH